MNQVYIANGIGVYTSCITAITNDRLRIYGKSLAIGSIDNVSVKEVGQAKCFFFYRKII